MTPSLSLKWPKWILAESLRVYVQWVDVSIGDYVLAHAGMAISVINAEEAEETLKDLEKLCVS